MEVVRIQVLATIIDLEIDRNDMMVKCYYILILFFLYIELTPYHQGGKGLKRCANGYERIRDPKTCKLASKYFNLEYSASRNSITAKAVCYLCGGCSPETTSVADNYATSARWICKRKGTLLQNLHHKNIK